MNTFGLADFDELILTVRNKISRAYIEEAVNAYRSRAYKSAIISVWIAVTYDIISKIRELASYGDKMALAFVADLDNAIANGNIRQLARIEGDLLNKAHNDFEFISAHEFSDLERIKDDRNNCAHPAFVDPENLFQPTAEIVRAHIVHAILHLLRHQPVQGKAALDRVLNDIRQPSFPSDKESVSKFLLDKYLNRAKESLVRNLVVVLTKILLKGDPEFDGKGDLLVNSLLTISESHSRIFDEVQASKLSGIVETLNEDQLKNVFQLLAANPRCWHFLTQAAKIRIKGNFVQCLNSGYPQYLQQKYRLIDAFVIQELKDYAVSEFDNLDALGQSVVISQSPSEEFTDTAIEIFINSTSFASAKILGENALLPVATFLTPEQIIRVLGGIPRNRHNQILPAWGMQEILLEFFEVTIDKLDLVRDAWSNLARVLSTEPYSTEYATLLGRLQEAGVVIR